MHQLLEHLHISSGPYVLGHRADRAIISTNGLVDAHSVFAPLFDFAEVAPLVLKLLGSAVPFAVGGRW